MNAQKRKPARSRAKSPLIVIGAVIGTIPSLHAADHRPFALPVERRITLEPRRLEAALAHVKIWTPSETLPLLFWQDASGAAGLTARASGRAAAVAATHASTFRPVRSTSCSRRSRRSPASP